VRCFLLVRASLTGACTCVRSQGRGHTQMSRARWSRGGVAQARGACATERWGRRVCVKKLTRVGSRAGTILHPTHPDFPSNIIPGAGGGSHARASLSNSLKLHKKPHFHPFSCSLPPSRRRLPQQPLNRALRAAGQFRQRRREVALQVGGRFLRGERGEDGLLCVRLEEVSASSFTPFSSPGGLLGRRARARACSWKKGWETAARSCRGGGGGGGRGKYKPQPFF